MILLELKNLQLRLDQEASAHQETVATLNADNQRRRSIENYDFESIQCMLFFEFTYSRLTSLCL